MYVRSSLPPFGPFRILHADDAGSHSFVILSVCVLTLRVFMRHPVVTVALEFKARVPSATLLLPCVAVDILTFIGVAHLELVRFPRTRASSFGWTERELWSVWKPIENRDTEKGCFTHVPWIITFTCAKLDSSTTGAGALAKLAP